MTRHISVPRRERHDPGRVLYHLLRDDLPGLYTVGTVGEPQSYLRVPAWTHPRFVRFAPPSGELANR